MVQTATYERISPTAKMVAFLRTLTDIPFAKEIAAEIGTEKDFQTLAGVSMESITQFTPLFEARYKATNQIIAQRRITQVLEIAAGLSPRGFEMTSNPKVVFIATDLPQILEQAKVIEETIFKKMNIHRPNFHFQIANALVREDLLQAATPFAFDKPIAIITEGLLLYLTREEKEALAGNIYVLLNKYGGLWITSDVNSIQSWEKLSQGNEDMQQQQIQNLSDITGRNIEKNMFSDENDMRQLFTKSGFKIEAYPYSNVLEELSCLKRLNLNRDEIFKVLQKTNNLILTL